MLITLAGLAFAAAVRVIDRVHRDTADRRPNTTPALRTGLADLAQVVLFVADLADRRATVHVRLAQLAGAQTNRDVLTFARNELHGCAGAACKLRTPAGLH